MDHSIQHYIQERDILVMCRPIVLNLYKKYLTYAVVKYLENSKYQVKNFAPCNVQMNLCYWSSRNRCYMASLIQ